MNKRLRNIVITAAVLAGLVAVYFGVTILIPQLQDVITPDKAKTLINVEKVNLRHIDIDLPKSQTDFGVAVTMDSKLNPVYKILNDNVFAYDQSTLSVLGEYVCKLESIKTVTEKAEELKQYGLGEGCTVITATYADGSKNSIYVGDVTPTDDGYYVKLGGSDAVYIVNKGPAMSLTNNLWYYRDKNLLFDAGTSNANVKSLKITDNAGKTKLDITRLSSSEVNDKDIILSAFFIRSPLAAYADDTNLDLLVLTPIFAITTDTIVEDYPKDLGKYGLDKNGGKKPETVELLSTSGEVKRLLIGNATEDGYRYVMLEGIPSVFVGQSDYSFLAVPGENLVNDLLWLHNIKLVSKIDIGTSFGTYHYTVNDSTNNEGTGTFVSAMNGKNLSEKDSREFFKRCISLAGDGLYTGALPAKADLTLTMTYKDGTVKTLKLRKVNPRQYAAEVEGTTTFAVSITEVKLIEDGLKDIAAGKALGETY